MVEIDKLYLFKTVDKSPYVFTPDPNAFGAISVSSAAPTLISSLQLVASNAILFDDCVKAYFDYDVLLDFEKQLPIDGSVPHESGCIYDYRLKITRENTDKQFNNDFNRYVSYLAGNVFQVAFHTIDGNWFLCYAQFEITDTVVDNDIVQSISFQAKDAKEEKYLVSALTEV